MTTIAWDGKVLAADNGGHIGGLVFRTLKIEPVVINGVKYIVASAGSGAFARDAIQLMQGERTEMASWKEYDDELTLGSMWGIAINAEGECFRIDASLQWDKVLDPFTAYGSGMEVAIGALAAGASAPRAIEIAAEYTPGCAMHGVTAMRFTQHGLVEIVT